MNPAAARRRFVLIQALTWLPIGIMMPASILLMLDRGIGLATVGTVVAVQSVLVAVLELPTGGLADVLGRRGVLIAAAGASLIALTGLAFAVSPWQFAACAVLKATGRALSSGPAEAWYVDQVHTTLLADTDAASAELRTGLSRGHAAESAALCVGALTGGALPAAAARVLPSEGLLVPLSVPSLVAAVGMAALLFSVLFGLPEPAAPVHRGIGAVLRDIPRTVRDGIQLGTRDRRLGRILLLALALGTMLSAIELLTPPRLADLSGSAERGAALYAVVTAAGFAGSAAGSTLSTTVVRVLRDATRTVLTGGALAILALLGLAASLRIGGTAGVVATGTGYVLLFVGLGIAGPVQSAQLHARVPASARATAVSVSSLLLQSGGVAANLGLTRLAAAGMTGLAWVLSAVTAGGVLAAYPRDRVQPRAGSDRSRPGATRNRDRAGKCRSSRHTGYHEGCRRCPSVGSIPPTRRPSQSPLA